MTLDELLADIFGVKATHNHRWVRVSSFGWFRCADCDATTHSLACWDGTKFDCCCGLDDERESA